MKLATLRDGSRDGRLVVVSRDVTQASDARHIAPTLQAALDGWDRLAPHLDLVARGVESGGQPVTRFHERDAMAPLPRAYRFSIGPLEPSARPGPLLCDCRSDGLLGARDAVLSPDDGGAFGMDADGAFSIDANGAFSVEAGVAVVLGDVPHGADRTTALAAIRLIMLMNCVTPRGANAADAGAISAPFAFSPTAVTPDELGPAWDGATLRGVLTIEVEGAPLARPKASTLMEFDFGDLIVEAARARPLGAGAIIGMRAVATPAANGPPLGSGGAIRIEMRDVAGHSIFGAIERRAERLAEG